MLSKNLKFQLNYSLLYGLMKFQLNAEQNFSFVRQTDSRIFLLRINIQPEEYISIIIFTIIIIKGLNNVIEM